MDQEILQRNLTRLQKLSARLQSAKNGLSQVMPLKETTFNPETLNDDLLLRLDGFRVRFADLQDLLGHVIFPMVCRYDEDETSAHPLSSRERQVLMEKKGLIELAQWKMLREIRNHFMHEYPDEHEEKAMILNQAWESTDKLVAIANNIDSYILESL